MAKKTAKKATKKPTAKKQMTKSELIQKLTDAHGDSLKRRDVKSLLETLAEIGYAELKKKGAFVLPGFAKLVVVKKPATKARKGINPFTGEPTISRRSRPARSSRAARSRRPRTRSLSSARSTHSQLLMPLLRAE